MISTAHELRAMLHLLLTAMVKDREAVRITTVVTSQGTTIFCVWVAEGDLGKVIGGQGKNIQALRTVVYSIAKEHGLSVALELCDSRNEDELRVRSRLAARTPAGSTELQTAVY